MEDAYIINGGKKLIGDITLSGAKNVALKTIIGALLFDSKVVLENIPRINDVLELLNLIRELGVTAEFVGPDVLEVDPSGLKHNKVDLLYASKTRVSFMLFAPLLHKFSHASTSHPGGDVFIPNPGGCRLGARPIDRIITGMKALGVDVNYNHRTGYYEASLNQGIAGEYEFPKQTHTGTELLIMLAVCGQDQVILKNAALEPEIDDLIGFLNQAGAKITRHDKKIMITPVERLVQKKPYRIISDRNEAVTFAVLAASSGGDITIKDIEKDHMGMLFTSLKSAGCGVDRKKGAVRFYSLGGLRPVSIVTDVYPGFMTDWQPNWAVLMTQASGESIIHERMFENRFAYVDELRKLGADIEFIDPKVENPQKFYEFNYDPGEIYQQAIRIKGPQKLHNGVLTIADLRAGATLAIAALLAPGKSIIHGASILERGYEDFVGKVRSLGGDIKKI